MYKGLDLSTSSLQPSLFHLLSPTYLIPIYAMPLQSLNWIHNQFISLGGMILHYNVGHCDLQPFFWWIAPSLQMYLTHGLLKRLHSRPVNWEGQRIPPDELSVHKGTHFFQLPGCLCSRQIHRHRESECVINGIFCQIIWVNGCFGARGMPVPTSASLFFFCHWLYSPDPLQYPLNSFGITQVLWPDITLYSISGSNTFVWTCTHSISVPCTTHVSTEAASVMELLLQVDHWENPGITAKQFTCLFTQCRCGLITTRWAFRFHTCLLVQVINLTQDDNTVIDLTSDD